VTARESLVRLGLGLGAAVYGSVGVAAGILALPYLLVVPAGPDGSLHVSWVGLIAPFVWGLWGLVCGPVAAAVLNVLFRLVGGVPITAARAPVETP
jgi:hypothetical protein